MLMMAEENGPPPLKRVKLSLDDVQTLSKEELIEKWQEQEALIDVLLSKNRPIEEDEISTLRESEEKLKIQQTEANRRENVLVMRLAAKEQEMQEYVTQIQELKQAQNTSAAQLRTMLLDPAVNIMFQRMKKEMDASKEKLEQAQNDLAAWKFTPDSQTGKRLMAKCRMLLQENEELGKVISSGRTAKLEGEIALEKTLVQEMKKSQAEMDEFLLELDEDVEGMQSTIYLLQQQLKEAKEQISQLQEENIRLGGHQADSMIADANAKAEPISRRSTPTPNALETHVENDERTRHADEKPHLSPSSKPGYQRTSRQSSTSPSIEVVVSNHKRDHQIGSKRDYIHTQTNRPATTNGGHDHSGYEAMDTSDAGFHKARCDVESTTGDHGTHRQFTGSHKPETTVDGSRVGGSNLEVNNHHQGDPNSDVSYVVTENIDAVSSEDWSPSSHHLRQSDDIEMEDDHKIKSEIKGRTVRGVDLEGSDDEHQTLLQNGLMNTTPQYESQNDDDVVV